MKIQESAENYLETILVLSQRHPQVRSIDIATEHGHISLTASGLQIAETIYERHTLLSSWLEFLGVDSKIAAQDACRIEHVISPESFQAIKTHVAAGMKDSRKNK